MMNLSENELLEICRLAVKLAVTKGADEAEAYGVSSMESEAAIERNDIMLGKYHQASGLGIRVLKNRALGFSSINRLGRAQIDSAVDAALQIASRGSSDPFNVLPKPSKIPRLTGILYPEAASFSPEETLRHAVDLLETAKRYDKRVTVDSGGFNTSLYSHAIVNSNGVEGSEAGSGFSWFIMGMAIQGEEVSSFDFQFDGSHHMKNIDVGTTANRFAENVVSSLGSKQCEACKGPLILGPEAAIEVGLQT